MNKLYRCIEGMWWSKHKPPLLLRMLEPLYRIISSRKLKQRTEKRTTPLLPLISVGNITAGGSGKTPFVIWLAHALKEKGYSPVILCRGDGGSSSAPTILDDQSDPALVGDEACLLADSSGCLVISAKDRIAACQLAESLGDIIILDDGFQYRHLARVCDIVLVPAIGTGNGHLIPAGPLRESPEALERADIVVRTGSRQELDQSLPLSVNREWQWQSKAEELTNLMNSGATPPSSLHAVTAIARPQRFFDSLTTSGFKLSGTSSFPDHHPFKRKEVNDLLCHPDVVITGKDAVKLTPLWPKDRALWMLKLEGDGESGLVEAICSRLPSQT